MVKQWPKLVHSHEMEHAVHVPKSSLEDNVVTDKLLSFMQDGSSYFGHNNNTEIGARISQIWNNLGITDNSPVTGAQLKKQFETYLAKPNQLDNEVKLLYDNVMDWDKLTKWASDPKNVYVTVGAAMVPSYLTYVSNDYKSQKVN